MPPGVSPIAGGAGLGASRVPSLGVGGANGASSASLLGVAGAPGSAASTASLVGGTLSPALTASSLTGITSQQGLVPASSVTPPPPAMTLQGADTVTSSLPLPSADTLLSAAPANGTSASAGGGRASGSLVGLQAQTAGNGVLPVLPQAPRPVGIDPAAAAAAAAVAAAANTIPRTTHGSVGGAQVRKMRLAVSRHAGWMRLVLAWFCEVLLQDFFFLLSVCLGPYRALHTRALW